MSLGPDARSLVDTARDGDEPSPDDAARVRARLARQLGVAAGAGAAATMSAKSASAIGASALSLGAKVLFAVAVAGGIATGIAVFHEPPHTTPPVVATTAPPAAAPVLATVQTHVTEPAPSPPSSTRPNAAPPRTAQAQQAQTRPQALASATLTAMASDAPGRSADGVVPRSPAGAAEKMIATGSAPERSHGAAGATRALEGASASEKAHEIANAAVPAQVSDSAPAPPRDLPASAPVTADAVREEAAILRAAERALAEHDGPMALAQLEEHAARFPHGALVEERAAAHVLALCSVGRAIEARVEAARFLGAYPRSPLGAQVRGSCAGQ